jgi:Flp pilus assembly protein TadB
VCVAVATRTARRDRPRPGVARVRILIIAFAGVVLTATFARAARRYSVADRLRTERTRSARRVPLWLHARIERALDAAAVDVSVDRALSTWVWSIIVAAVVGIGVGGPQIALGLAVVVAVGVPVTVVSMRERRGRQISVAVPAALEHVASELRSGGTVATAIGAVATGDSPLALDMARIDARVRLGASIGQALSAWSTERDVAGVDASAGALAMCASVGGRSADALDGLATSLRDRLGVAAEARALSSFVDPHALQVLTGTFFGRLCLVLGLGLEGLGGLWMRSIVRSGSRA